jgi:hypothetical protein
MRDAGGSWLRPPHHEGEGFVLNHFRSVTLFVVAALSVLLLAACSSGDGTPASPIPTIQPPATSILVPTPMPTTVPRPDAAFGEPFLLQVGEGLSVGLNDLRVTFQGVSEDSRCPSDVVCIWAGQVVVVVALEVGGGDPYSESLTVGVADKSIVTIGGYLLEAISVEPYPVSPGTIPSTAYVLRLIVSSL